MSLVKEALEPPKTSKPEVERRDQAMFRPSPRLSPGDGLAQRPRAASWSQFASPAPWALLTPRPRIHPSLALQIQRRAATTAGPAAERNAPTRQGDGVTSEKSGCACGAPGATSDPCPACSKVLAAASGRAALEREADEVGVHVAATTSPMFGGDGFSVPDAALGLVEVLTGTFLRGVKLRRDAVAADAVDSRAFASHDEIVFGAGQFAPETRDGMYLIGHELAHIAQVRSGRAPAEAVLCAPRQAELEPRVTIEEGVPPTLVFDRPVDPEEAKRILFGAPPPGVVVQPAPGTASGVRQTRWRVTFGSSENVFRLRNNLGPRYVAASIVRSKGPPPPPLVDQIPKWLPANARTALAQSLAQANLKRGAQAFDGPPPWGQAVVWFGRQQEFETTDPEIGKGRIVTGSADVIEAYLEYPSDLNFYLPYVDGDRGSARLLRDTYAAWNRDMRHLVFDLGTAPSAAREQLNVINTALFAKLLDAISKVFLVGSGIRAAQATGGRPPSAPTALRLSGRGAPTSAVSGELETAVSTAAKEEAETTGRVATKEAEAVGATTGRATPAAGRVAAGLIDESIAGEVYFVRDPAHSRFVARGSIGVHGELLIDLRTELEDGTRSTLLRGKEQVRKIMDFFRGRFSTIKGNWTFGTNLRKVNELTEGGKMSVQDAARQTWTGELAIASGFKNVTVLGNPQGTSGKYTSVQVLFSR